MSGGEDGLNFRSPAWLSPSFAPFDTEVPGLARRAVAQALRIDADRVEVHFTLLGGGFGRRLDVDFSGQAAAIASAAKGAPVQAFWSCAEDSRHDFYRAACVARFDAGFDAQRRLTAWRNVAAGQAIVPAVLQRTFGLPGAGPDKTTAEGAFDQPYEWPAARIAHAAVQFPMPVGFSTGAPRRCAPNPTRPCCGCCAASCSSPARSSVAAWRCAVPAPCT